MVNAYWKESINKFIPREDCFKFSVGGLEPFDMVSIQIDFSDGQHNDAWLERKHKWLRQWKKVLMAIFLREREITL